MAKKPRRKITLPKHFDPGPKHPRETLAYLSPAERRMIIAAFGPGKNVLKGILSYADDSASSMGTERPDTGGGNPGYGGGGFGNTGALGGQMSSGTGARGPTGPSGSPSRTGSNQAAGSASTNGASGGRPNSSGGGGSSNRSGSSNAGQNMGNRGGVSADRGNQSAGSLGSQSGRSGTNSSGGLRGPTDPSGQVSGLSRTPANTRTPPGLGGGADIARQGLLGKFQDRLGSKDQSRLSADGTYESPSKTYGNETLLGKTPAGFVNPDYVDRWLGPSKYQDRIIPDKYQDRLSEEITPTPDRYNLDPWKRNDPEIGQAAYMGVGAVPSYDPLGSITAPSPAKAFADQAAEWDRIGQMIGQAKFQDRIAPSPSKYQDRLAEDDSPPDEFPNYISDKYQDRLPGYISPPGYPDRMPMQGSYQMPQRPMPQASYDPLSSMQVPSQAPRPSYDPLGSIQVPRQFQTAYDPLSSIGTPPRQPEAYDPLSSPRVPPQSPQPRQVLSEPETIEIADHILQSLDHIPSEPDPPQNINPGEDDVLEADAERAIMDRYGPDLGAEIVRQFNQAFSQMGGTARSKLRQSLGLSPRGRGYKGTRTDTPSPPPPVTPPPPVNPGYVPVNFPDYTQDWAFQNRPWPYEV